MLRISFALAEAMDDGHCGLPYEELLVLTQQLLEVPAELVETALGLELQDGTVIADDLDGRPCVFLAGLYRAEREIAEKVKALTAGKPPWPLHQQPVVTAIQLVDLGQPRILAQQIGESAALKPLTVQPPFAARRQQAVGNQHEQHLIPMLAASTRTDRAAARATASAPASTRS